MESQITLDQLIHQDYSIGIVGLGVENKKFLNWLIDVVHIDPKRIVLADLKLPELDYDSGIFQATVFGDNYLDICKLDIAHIFKAPGIWSLKEEFENFRAKRGPHSIHSSLIFFMQKFREQIIGVTGTKGKTTTSSLIKHILTNKDFIREYESLHHSIPTAIYTGNSTNTSPYDYWRDLDKSIETNQYFVLELSSFQLQDLGFDEISPKRCVITNYYIDHQDQHLTIEEYWNSKNNIHRFQQEGDYVIGSKQVRGKVLTNKFPQYNLWIENTISDGLLAHSKSQIIGSHNRMNMALALLTSMTVLNPHIRPAEMAATAQSFISTFPNLFEDFASLRHRLEKIATLNTEVTVSIKGTTKSIPLEIVGINDSQSTMPDATMAGLRALTEKVSDTVWLIIQGKDKGVSVDQLCSAILEIQANHQLFRVDYFGQIGQRILNELYKTMGSESEAGYTSIKGHLPKDLADTDQLIKEYQSWIQTKIDESEDTGEDEYVVRIASTELLTLYICLSPAGSSFDEFKNSYERGDWFSELIKKSLE